MFILIVEENVPWHVITSVGFELTVLPPLEAVWPEAVAWSETLEAVEVSVALQVPLCPAPRVDGVTVKVAGEVGVLLLEPATNVIASLTLTLNIVPIPVLVTVPLTGKLMKLPDASTAAAPHDLDTLRPQTGKPPSRKSFNTALVDCDERVSSRKLVKQGSWVTPTPARACVISTPPSKNNGDAKLPPHELFVVAEFVIAQ